MAADMQIHSRPYNEKLFPTKKWTLARLSEMERESKFVQSVPMYKDKKLIGYRYIRHK